MMFFAPLVTVFLAALSVLAAPSASVTVSYDEVYDNAGGSLATVACSDGPNGLLTKGQPKHHFSTRCDADPRHTGFTTFGSLPTFPNIGGASAVAGWNSPSCGSCWQLTYNGTSINVLAVDHTDAGFNIGLKALNKLTKNQGVFLGRVNAQFKQLANSACGL